MRILIIIEVQEFNVLSPIPEVPFRFQDKEHPPSILYIHYQSVKFHQNLFGCFTLTPVQCGRRTKIQYKVFLISTHFGKKNCFGPVTVVLYVQFEYFVSIIISMCYFIIKHLLIPFKYHIIIISYHIIFSFSYFFAHGFNTKHIIRK